MDNPYQEKRDFLKAQWELLEGWNSDQQQRVEAPAIEEPYPVDAVLIELPAPATLELGDMALIDAINLRRSERKYDEEKSLSLAELSFLLWVTQGVKSVPASAKATLRTVPSGGARHSFETYLAISRIEGLAPGIYRYLALSHKLLLVSQPADLPELVREACLGQRCGQSAAVTFFWTSVPYRAEWRYGPVSHKMIAIDAGHVCQNLYLACQAIGCGTVAVGAYDQAKCDALTGVEGQDQFTVYAAPVGKL